MTTQAQLDAILRQLEPELRKAMLEAFNGMREGVDMRALTAAIEAGNVEMAIEALNIDEGYFTPYVIAATLIYMRYGRAFGPTLAPGFRFNPVATNAGQNIIAENVGRMTEETRQMARGMIAQGLGRRETARRIRSVVGLSTPQAGFVENMRSRLESGDPAELRKILGPKNEYGRYTGGMTQRDKRYDATIRKAIETGSPIPAAKIDQMTEAYARKLQKKRAEDNAAAEADQYAETAKYEAARQAVEKDGGEVIKTWRHSSIYLNARPDHVGMSGVSVRGMNTAFIMFDGVAMQHAHDPAGGARHNANCRCRTTYRIDRNGGL